MRRDPYVTVGEVAAYCGVSESGLYALFKSTLNETPNRVRRQILCERAKELLSTTDLTVEQISSQLSFSSSSYFRKVFYEHIGKTPREVYREARNI
ncbi:MAG: helix-turn-helix domain-containing protein [Clostridia bacterium]|nr:helix-turn-helix domain-containing protein [Clostridia bacterium]